MSKRGLNVRFIILAVIALALVVLVGSAVSRCVGQGASGGSSSATAPAASATAQSSAASAASDSSQSGDAASAAASSSAESATAQTRGVAAQQGDVSYIVAQAAKLSYRNVDFAVDPNRRDWNFDKSNGHKTIYLTFDDGPSANTERVLDILDQYNCKATFFVTGQYPDFFPWMKEAYKRGHTIGLHSMTHDYDIYESSEKFWADMDAIGQVVKEQIGYVPCFIRFPGGSSNTISADYAQGIMGQLAEEVQARGYQYYDWELSCGDGANLSAEETKAAGCEGTDSENAIYLAHDTKETTVEALPTIIEFYQAQGYTFEAIDRSTMVNHHGISN